MGTIWVRELIGGLDTRRMPEAAPDGTLIRADDGHITSGGEFEKRAAFVPRYALPAGTVGLAHTRNSLIVFGHQTEPGGIPPGVVYQRLQHPDSVALARILSYDLFAGRVYVVAQFEDTSIHHFYDGVRVEDWFDGRARATFEIISGHEAPLVEATGSFRITGGTAGSGNEIVDVTVNGVSLISAPVAFVSDASATALAVANAINAHTSAPDYTATSDDETVIIESVGVGPAANGLVVAVDPDGDVTVGDIGNMAGGAVLPASRVTGVTVNGEPVIGGPVLYATSVAAMAEAVAAAINAFPGDPDYSAVASGGRVTIIAPEASTAFNNHPVVVSVANGLQIDIGGVDVLRMAGGAATESFIPGTAVRTMGSKMYAVADGVLHFSGIKEPTQWTTDAVGAGFIDMSEEASGAEKLTAVAQYQAFVAVFAEDVILVWAIDPDPALSHMQQVLANTGTRSPRSVTRFGDEDIFYLDESGCRSLRARDSSNAASTSDVGVLVDKPITAKLATLTDDQRLSIFGLINPRDGRYWLCMLNEIFVFSYYPATKVSAWSRYIPRTVVDGVETLFDIDAAVVTNRRVYLRSGNVIYAYGGEGPTVEYDESPAEAWSPYFDADQPADLKQWSGFDASVEGLWDVEVGMQVSDVEISEPLCSVWYTTYNGQRVGLDGQSSHINLRFVSRETGPARISAFAVHYLGGESEG